MTLSFHIAFVSILAFLWYFFMKQECAFEKKDDLKYSRTEIYWQSSGILAVRSLIVFDFRGNNAKLPFLLVFYIIAVISYSLCSAGIQISHQLLSFMQNIFIA